MRCPIKIKITARIAILDKWRKAPCNPQFRGRAFRHKPVQAARMAGAAGGISLSEASDKGSALRAPS